LNWRSFVKEVPTISVPKIKASSLGYAYRKVDSRSRTSTLELMIR